MGDQSFTKTTGEPSIFGFAESSSGRFHGEERVFWTSTASCSPVDTSNTVAGVVSAADGTGNSTLVTLLAVLPNEYLLCYDDDGPLLPNPYKQLPNVKLTITGRCLFVCVCALCNVCKLIVCYGYVVQVWQYLVANPTISIDSPVRSPSLCFHLPVSEH